MKTDRSKIVDILARYDIYPEQVVYDALELYIDGVRTQAIGWAYTDACIALDKNEDPRLTEVPNILERAKKDLEVE